MEWKGYGERIKVNNDLWLISNQFLNILPFSFVAPRAVLQNNSQTNKVSLFDRQITFTNVCKVTSQVLRFDNHKQHLSEQLQFSQQCKEYHMQVTK